MTRIYYFSGTGNSLALAKGIAGLLGDAELSAINWAFPEPPPAGCRVGIVVPVYFLALPDIVTAFLERFVLAPGTRSFVVVNMGLMKGNALPHARALLKKGGAESVALYSIQMPDNSIAFPSSQEEIRGMLDASELAIKRVAEDIARSGLGDRVIWNPLYAVIGSFTKAYCERFLGFSDIKAGAACNGCGSCARSCPVKNIAMEGSEPHWGTECATCFACIHGCPKRAVSFRQMKRFAFVPYRHPALSGER